MKKFTWDIYTLVIFLYNKHKENKMTTKQMKTFKVIHFSMKVFILQHNCVKRTTTKCPKGDGKSDIGSYFLITEINISLIQFSSVTQSCPTLCDPMDSSTPGLPVHHQLLEFTHTHVLWVSDAFPFYLPCSIGAGCHNLSFFLMFSLKQTLSLSSFTLIKRLFSSSSLSAIRVISSAYLWLLMLLSPILILACNSSSPGHFSWCAQHIG